MTVVSCGLELPVYRDNEASRVGAVLERKHAGDRAGMIAAAIDLWLSPSDPSDPGADDPTQAEVWAAIEDAGATEEAAVAALRVLRDGNAIRPDAFVDITEAVADPGVQLELAGRALGAEWPAQVYLAAPLLRLIETGRASLVHDFIAEHRAQLQANAASWTAIAALLTTAPVGHHVDLVSWFDGWWAIRGVPMWVLHGYAAVTGASEMTLIDLADRATAHAVPDVTLGYFAAVPALFDLRGSRYQAFRVRMAGHGALLVRLAELGARAHPAARYLGRIQHLLSVAPYLGEPGAVSGDGEPRLKPNRLGLAIAERLRTIAASAARMASVLPLFVELFDTPPGSPSIAAQCRRMAQSRIAELPIVQPAWDRLVAAKRAMW